MLKKVHAYLGLFLVLPFFIWAVTGAVFLVKPGYQKAYEIVEIKKYPLLHRKRVPSGVSWRQATFVRSILGTHLLIIDEDGERKNINAVTYKDMPLPSMENTKMLVLDILDFDPDRYGKIASLDLEQGKIKVETTTNIKLNLDWNTLTVTQVGEDTLFINRLYRLHYMQWTPDSLVNKILAILALVVLLIMSMVSLRMIMKFNDETEED